MGDVRAAASLLAFSEARNLVVDHALSLRAGATERVPLLQAPGRILAAPIIADRDLPPFPRSTRDGFAVRSSDLEAVPATLTLTGEIRAGAFDPATLPTVDAGAAVEIMTGAPLPPGADAVAMLEYTSRSGERVQFKRKAHPGENVVARGAEAHAGDILVQLGSRVDQVTVALAASVGWASLTVFTKPRVTVLSTGDEIVDITAQPGPHHIRNSNTYSLAAQIIAAGADPSILPIAPDEPKRLRELIDEGLHADLLLITGGVSMGKYDLVEQVLESFDARFLFTGVAIQPGKPLVFGDASGFPKRTPFFGLPGNPVSTMVTFELFVKPVIDTLTGAKPRALRFTQVRLRERVRHKLGLTRFLPALLTGELDRTELELLPWQGSGDLVTMARANCYIVLPPDREEIAAGEMVSILLRGTEF